MAKKTAGSDFAQRMAAARAKKGSKSSSKAPAKSPAKMPMKSGGGKSGKGKAC